MNSSRSFDRAASYYDQTRPLPEFIAEGGDASHSRCHRTN